MKRVVITGMGAVSPFGAGVDVLYDSIMEGKSAVAHDPELAEIKGLRSFVSARVPSSVDPQQIPRKYRRTMSDMSIFATIASLAALKDAALPEDSWSNGNLGVCIGSTVGSPQAMQDFFEHYLPDHTLEGLKSGPFFKIMNHSCASNVALALGVTGRIIGLGSACATGNQAIGLAYELISGGRQQRVLCGGADEAHALATSVFDILNAASVGFNDNPTGTPQPFDAGRDGVVCGEGAGVLLLESLESAQERGARILAEVIGFATISDTSNIAHPDPAAMEKCMRMALADAGLKASDIDYISAHATGTEHGDVAEGEAICRVFADPNPPVSSLKGHMGHTMAASGSLELIASICMMEAKKLVPTRNLLNPDPAFEGINLLLEPQESAIRTLIKNSFAFGGVNSSVVVREYLDD